MAIFNGSHNTKNGQIHWFSKPFREDVFNIGLNNVNANGTARHDSHHVYGYGGDDLYNFVDFDSLVNRTTGRLDTFDPTRDRIQIEGTTINDLSNLPSKVNGVSLAVVDYLGQQWLRMLDGNSKGALFALEGARKAANVINDVERGDRTGDEERHFHNLSLNEMKALDEITYVNPNNFVPHEFYEGRSLRNVDGNSKNVNGSNSSDLIYARKFSDDEDRSSQVIKAGGGSDVVHARSGDDTVYGGSGNDALAGGIDEDKLYGQSGNDTLFGGDQNDYIHGGSGRDLIFGGADNDLIRGGTSNDTMSGDQGEDVFQFQKNEMVRWGSISGNATQRYTKIDKIDDFTLGEDLIHFTANTGIDELSDLRMWKRTIDGDRHFVIHVKATGERILVNTDEDVEWTDIYEEENFIFGNRTTVITDDDMYRWGDLNGTNAQKNAQLTVVEDFDIGTDTIRFTGSTDIDSLSDLRMWKTTIDGNVHFTIRERATNERILVDVDDNVSWSQIYDENNFVFG